MLLSDINRDHRVVPRKRLSYVVSQIYITMPPLCLVYTEIKSDVNSEEVKTVSKQKQVYSGIVHIKTFSISGQ